jgi:F-type H+-transporting ATPase subunit b
VDNLLTINPGLVFWTIVSFVLLVVLLGKFAWGPILAALEKREHGIAEAVKGAEEAHQKAEAVLAEQRALLARAEGEAEAHREKARRDAETQVAAMLAEGQTKAEALLERARREIGLEEQRAIAAVRGEAARLAIEAASRLIQRNLNSDDNRRLVEQFLVEVQKAEAPKGGAKGAGPGVQKGAPPGAPPDAPRKDAP